MNKRRLKKAFLRLRKLPLNHNLVLYTANKVAHFMFKAARSTRVARPSTIMLELTNHCNLACTTCPREYEYGKQMDKGFMKTDHVKAVIDELYPYLDSIGLTGMGETMMYKDITETAKYIRSKNTGIVISVSTNAQLPDFIDKVRNIADLIDTIQVSVDGLDEVYNSIRIKGDFELLEKNLKSAVLLCSGTRTDIMLNMVVTKENYTQMPSMVSFAHNNGIRYLNFSMINLAAITNTDKSYYSLYNTPEFKFSQNELKKAISANPDVLVTGVDIPQKNGFKNCPFPWTHFYICWNGFMVPCCAKPFPKELNFGNVFESGVMPVLNSKSFRSFRKLWYMNKTPHFCDKCHFIEASYLN